MVATQNGLEAADQPVERLGRGVVATGAVRIVSFLVARGHVRHAGTSMGTASRVAAGSR